MKADYFNETASTSLEVTPAHFVEGTRTSLPTEVTDVRLAGPQRFVACFVLGAAFSSSGFQGVLNFADVTRRRLDDVTAESSTAVVGVDPALLDDIHELFDQGTTEFFHDGVHSNFSRTLLRTLTQHGDAAFRAIAEYLYSGCGTPDVVAEALRWIAEYNDLSTVNQRWAILRHKLNDHSPRVRDGAILGFAALDDERARPVLLEARNLEQLDELRKLIDQVVAQLGRSE